jgi:hypothetical protein
MGGTTTSQCRLGDFHRLLRTIRENGGDIVFINMPEAIRIFSPPSSWSPVFFFATEEEALAYFEGG